MPALLRGLHILAVSAWLGGGLGVLLLLILGNRADSSDEVKAYNLVITAIDDLLISPGAAGTLATGLLLSRSRRKAFPGDLWLAVKLLVTLTAILFGTLFLAPWLKGLLSVTTRDGLAVFDDREYFNAYCSGLAGALFQTTMLLGLLWGSVARKLPVRGKKCGSCPLSHGNG
jgi:uncharacterized membrane protein